MRSELVQGVSFSGKGPLYRGQNNLISQMKHFCNMVHIRKMFFFSPLTSISVMNRSDPTWPNHDALSMLISQQLLSVLEKKSNQTCKLPKLHKIYVLQFGINQVDNCRDISNLGRVDF